MRTIEIEMLRSDKYFSVLIFLLPAALITGPFLSDLFVSIISIYFIYVLFKQKIYHYLHNKFSYLFLIFYLYIILLSIISDNVLLSLESSLFFFRFLLFTLCVAYLVNVNKNFIDYLKYAFLFTMTILVVDAYIQFFSGANILGFVYSYSRVSSFFNDELVLGSYLARMMPIVLGLVAIKSKINKKEFYFALLLLVSIDILTFLSGERTAFFLITLATIILIFTVRNFRFLRLISFVISSIIIIFLTFSFENVKERMIDQTLNQTGILSSQDTYIVSELHTRYYYAAIQMFYEKPLIGHGPKMYREVCSYVQYVDLNACSTHPHNNYLQSLAELGIIGTIPIIFLFFFVSSRIIKHLYMKIIYKKQLYDDYEICFFVAILISLWPFVPTGNLFNNWLNIIYFLPVGLLLAKSIKFR